LLQLEYLKTHLNLYSYWKQDQITQI